MEVHDIMEMASRELFLNSAALLLQRTTVQVVTCAVYGSLIHKMTETQR